MQGRLLGISESLSAAWQTFKRLPGVLIGVFLIYLVITMAVSYIPIVGPIISLFITPPIMGGVIIVGLKAVRGETPEIGEMFLGFQDYWHWMGVYWLFIAIMLATMIPLGIGAAVAAVLGTFKGSVEDPSAITGIAVMVVTGLISIVLYIVYGIRFMFAWYAAADLRDIVECFSTSAVMTEARRLELFGIAIVLGLLAVAGIIACGVGYIFTVMLTYLAFMHIYDALRGQAPQPTLPEAPTT
jgi:hypothetical protein